LEAGQLESLDRYAATSACTARRIRLDEVAIVGSEVTTGVCLSLDFHFSMHPRLSSPVVYGQCVATKTFSQSECTFRSEKCVKSAIYFY
jgi:hypothetical protein